MRCDETRRVETRRGSKAKDETGARIEDEILGWGISQAKSEVRQRRDSCESQGSESVSV